MLKRLLRIPLRIFYDHILKVYKRRIAYYIASLCEDGSTVLDVGCDDGSLAKIIVDIKPSLKFEGVDIQDHRSYGKISEAVYSVFDYFANVAYGITCAFTYPSLTRWKRYFQESQLEIVAQPTPLDYNFFLTDKTNPIFKLMK